jgi:hypothetical protein
VVVPCLITCTGGKCDDDLISLVKWLDFCFFVRVSDICVVGSAVDLFIVVVKPTASELCCADALFQVIWLLL